MAIPVRLNLAINHKTICDDHLCADVDKILKAVRPAWFEKKGQIRAKRLTEGLCNLLICYYLDGKFDEDAILVRVYGENSEITVDRQAEKRNMLALSAAGRGPLLYAEFINGIVYGFVYGETIDVHSIRDETVRKLVAKEIIACQKVRPNGEPVRSELWYTLYRYLELIPDELSDEEKNKKYKANIPSKAELRAEVDQLRSHLERLNSPIVYCHNDLLVHNIIYNKDNGYVRFIDHEFAMYNYEHFELGNHFAEHAGINDINVALYPDKAYQLVWLRYYLEQKALDAGQSPDTVTDRDVEECYVKTNKFALAAHMFWGLCSLVQVQHSHVDFGFLDYAIQKFKEYFARKEDFYALKLPQ